MFKLPHFLLRTRWRVGLACSSLAHLIAAGLIAGELFLRLSLSANPPPAGVMLEAPPIAAEPRRVTIDVGLPPAEPWMAASASNLSDLIASVDDPRWTEALLEAHSSEADAARSSDFITRELLAAIAAAEQRSAEANLDRLETLSDQLNSVSSAESIDEMTASLQRWLGAGERATEPAPEPVAGEFDFGTAQLHDVLRDDSMSMGQVRYTAVLLDAAGRTIESPLSEAEGESVYRVMQIMKDNPLLERVYRGIVLAFMDKLLAQSGKRGVNR